MMKQKRINYYLGVAITSLLVACSADGDTETANLSCELIIKDVTYSSWGNLVTRASSTPDATGKEIWVSANDATPSLYAYSTTSTKYEVKSGSPQEWNGVTAWVYGFYTSTNANRVNTPLNIAVNQDGTQSYDFQASERKEFTYSTQNSDGVTLALRQQVARVKITVEDGDAYTQVLMGNDLMYCSGMFQYTEPEGGAPKFHTSEGWWAFTGNRHTMTLTNPNGGNTFSAYILPQTIATASHFFRVYNRNTGRSAYYALPSNNYSLEEGHEYSCTLRQNMNVASIQVDEDFSNNSGDTKEINTVASN